MNSFMFDSLEIPKEINFIFSDETTSSTTDVVPRFLPITYVIQLPLCPSPTLDPRNSFPNNPIPKLQS